MPSPINAVNVRGEALNLAIHSVRVFPLDNDKRPLIRWRAGASSDSRAVRTMPWNRASLVGAVTGERFDVLDIDPEGQEWLANHRLRLPPTRTHHTRRGGRHLLFSPAAGLRNNAHRIAPGVDVRARGGYVAWWPATGLPVEHPNLLEPWPQWLLEQAMPQRHGAVTHVRHATHPDRYLAAALRMAADAVAGAKHGQRNDRLNAETWSLAKHADLAAETIRSAMLAAATAAGLSEPEASATIESAIKRRAGHG